LAEKMNELICPTCGLKCYTSSAYTQCDGCQAVFYASQSAARWPDSNKAARIVNQPVVLSNDHV